MKPMQSGNGRKGHGSRRAMESVTDEAAREVLRRARRSANLTQKDLSARMQCAPSFISDIERGGTRMSREHFSAIARALGREPGDLFVEVMNWKRQ